MLIRRNQKKKQKRRKNRLRKNKQSSASRHNKINHAHVAKFIDHHYRTRLLSPPIPFTEEIQRRIHQFVHNHPKLLKYNVFMMIAPKSGSSTLAHTLNKNHIPTLHCHNDFYFFHTLMKKKQILFHYLDMVSEIAKMNNKKIYVIDCYRKPIERRISSFFQSISGITNKNIHHMIQHQNEYIDELIYIFNQYVFQKYDDYEPLETFGNFREECGKEHFDFEKKYVMYEKNNVVFIKLRFEDIESWDSILSEIFGKKITFYERNVSKEKVYYPLYSLFKNKYRITQENLNYIKSKSFLSFYNTPEEVQKYLSYWENKSISSS